MRLPVVAPTQPSNSWSHTFSGGVATATCQIGQHARVRIGCTSPIFFSITQAAQGATSYDQIMPAGVDYLDTGTCAYINFTAGSGPIVSVQRLADQNAV